MDIIFNGTSCPIKYLHIGVQGNNLVDKIVFCVPRKTSDGLDLSEFTPYIKIQNVKENYIDKDGKLAIDKYDDQLRLTYRLRRKTTMYPCFEMQLQFEQPENGDCIVWQNGSNQRYFVAHDRRRQRNRGAISVRNTRFNGAGIQHRKHRHYKRR